MKSNLLVLMLTFVYSVISFSQQTLTWEIKNPKTNKWIFLGEKGSVQEAFIAAKLLPDPFVGKNEELFLWMEDFDWEFKATFTITKDQLNQKIDVHFPNIDTYAKVFLNKKEIAKTDNAFLPYTFPIEKLVKKGKNELTLIFESPINYQKKHKGEVGVVLPAPNDVGSIQIAPYCRKPQYQFGWDWSLRMNTIGFWKPVRINCYTENKVSGKNIQTLEIEPKAEQKFDLFLQRPMKGKLIWESKLFGKKEFEVNGNSISRREVIENPQLWWPAGQGKPNLYKDTWVLKTEKGELIYSENFTFGIKKVELIQEKDIWGTSFFLKVNNRPVFCKGGDYIPDDIFPSRITDEKLLNQVKSMSEANFNMVRVWGGGMYAEETFMSACDRYGIMVWHDFMFACAMYPGNDSFLKNVRKEVDFHIPRLASHASLVLFNGNNEVDVAWKNWGFQSKYNLTKKDNLLIESYYQKLFKELLPRAVTNWSKIPYEHTSPLSNWGKDEF